MTEETEQELERMYRVSDQMTTMHSILRDRFRGRALASDLTVLVGSGVAASFTFIDPSVAKVLNPFGVAVPILVGVLSLLIFILTLVQLRIDWNGKAALHSKAAESWATLKHELGRLKRKDAAATEAELAVFRAKYEAVTTGLVMIPDRQFAGLKRKHTLKIEISRALDRQPGAWIWFLRLRIWWRDNFSESKQGA